jgi:hypothetical protein
MVSDPEGLTPPARRRLLRLACAGGDPRLVQESA